MCTHVPAQIRIWKYGNEVVVVAIFQDLKQLNDAAIPEFHIIMQHQLIQIVLQKKRKKVLNVVNKI